MNVDPFAARVLAAFLTVSACAGAVAEPAPRTVWTRTRPLNPSAIRLLASAAQSSSIVAGLLDDLELTDIVVYLSDAMPGVESGPASKLVFLAMAGTTRYLLVRVDRWRLSPPERVAQLGHELQHALEVAAAPEVKNAEGLAQLYRRIGWEAQGNRFESEAARSMGHRIRREVAGRKL
jgi:hypothetical protein